MDHLMMSPEKDVVGAAQGLLTLAAVCRARLRNMSPSIAAIAVGTAKVTVQPSKAGHSSSSSSQSNDAQPPPPSSSSLAASSSSSSSSQTAGSSSSTPQVPSTSSGSAQNHPDQPPPPSTPTKSANDTHSPRPSPMKTPSTPTKSANDTHSPRPSPMKTPSTPTKSANDTHSPRPSPMKTSMAGLSLPSATVHRGDSNVVMSSPADVSPSPSSAIRTPISSSSSVPGPSSNNPNPSPNITNGNSNHRESPEPEPAQASPKPAQPSPNEINHDNDHQSSGSSAASPPPSAPPPPPVPHPAPSSSPASPSPSAPLPPQVHHPAPSSSSASAPPPTPHVHHPAPSSTPVIPSQPMPLPSPSLSSIPISLNAMLPIPSSSIVVGGGSGSAGGGSGSSTVHGGGAASTSTSTSNGPGSSGQFSLTQRLLTAPRDDVELMTANQSNAAASAAAATAIVGESSSSSSSSASASRAQANASPVPVERRAAPRRPRGRRGGGTAPPSGDPTPSTSTGRGAPPRGAAATRGGAARGRGARGAKRSSPQETDAPTPSTSSGDSNGGDSNDGLAQPRPKKKAYIPSYVQEGEKCVVCGDDSTGTHYRAMTCEGCKGFFRRTVQNNGFTRFECKYDKNCEVTHETRNNCQYCRYQKCIASRMSTDSVLSDSEREELRNLINSNRAGRDKALAQVLTEEEAGMILRLGQQFKAPNVRDFYQFSGNMINASSPSLQITHISPSVEHVMEFVNAIPGMQDVNPGDALTLLHHHMIDIVGLRLAEIFDKEQNALVFSNGVFTEADLVRYPWMTRIFKFAKRYSDFVFSDGTILGCLAAVRFLCTDNVKVENERPIDLILDNINYMLMKYLSQGSVAKIHLMYMGLSNFENVRQEDGVLLARLAMMDTYAPALSALALANATPRSPYAPLEPFEVPDPRLNIGAGSSSSSDHCRVRRQLASPPASAAATASATVTRSSLNLTPSDSSNGSSSSHSETTAATTTSSLSASSSSSSPPTSLPSSSSSSTADNNRNNHSQNPMSFNGARDAQPINPENPQSPANTATSAANNTNNTGFNFVRNGVNIIVGHPSAHDANPDQLRNLVASHPIPFPPQTHHDNHHATRNGAAATATNPHAPSPSTSTTTSSSEHRHEIRVRNGATPHHEMILLAHENGHAPMTNGNGIHRPPLHVKLEGQQQQQHMIGQPLLAMHQSNGTIPNIQLQQQQQQQPQPQQQQNGSTRRPRATRARRGRNGQGQQQESNANGNGENRNQLASTIAAAGAAHSSGGASIEAKREEDEQMPLQQHHASPIVNTTNGHDTPAKTPRRHSPPHHPQLPFPLPPPGVVTPMTPQQQFEHLKALTNGIHRQIYTQIQMQGNRVEGGTVPDISVPEWERRRREDMIEARQRNERLHQQNPQLAALITSQQPRTPRHHADYRAQMNRAMEEPPKREQEFNQEHVLKELLQRSSYLEQRVRELSGTHQMDNSCLEQLKQDEQQHRREIDAILRSQAAQKRESEVDLNAASLFPPGFSSHDLPLVREAPSREEILMARSRSSSFTGSPLSHRPPTPSSHIYPHPHPPPQPHQYSGHDVSNHSIIKALQGPPQYRHISEDGRQNIALTARTPEPRSLSLASILAAPGGKERELDAAAVLSSIGQGNGFTFANSDVRPRPSIPTSFTFTTKDTDQAQDLTMGANRRERRSTDPLHDNETHHLHHHQSHHNQAIQSAIVDANDQYHHHNHPHHHHHQQHHQLHNNHHDFHHPPRRTSSFSGVLHQESPFSRRNSGPPSLPLPLVFRGATSSTSTSRSHTSSPAKSTGDDSSDHPHPHPHHHPRHYNRQPSFSPVMSSNSNSNSTSAPPEDTNHLQASATAIAATSTTAAAISAASTSASTSAAASPENPRRGSFSSSTPSPSGSGSGHRGLNLKKRWLSRHSTASHPDGAGESNGSAADARKQ